MTKLSTTKAKEEKQATEDEAPEKKRMPAIAVADGHETDFMLSMAKEAYLEKHPDKEVVFAFDGEHLKRHSKIPKARIRGYKPVRVEELESEDPEIFGAPKDMVRVGDTVMMSCSKEAKERRDNAKLKKAVEKATLSLEVYKQSLEASGVKAGGEIKQGIEEYEVKPPEKKKEG